MSSALYASPGFFGVLGNKGSSSELQTGYNATLRLISGCLKMTKVDKLPKIVGWEDLAQRVSRRAAHLAYSALQHPQPSPAKQSLLYEAKNKKKRLKRKGWRELSEEHLPRKMYRLISPLPSRIAPWLSLKVIFSATSCLRTDDDTLRRNEASSLLDRVRNRLREYANDGWGLGPMDQ
ncbi:hypothetical protein FOZ62_014169 [Perkinsus olseni]|uniref:Uncharacterized protein n=1 Tax=Perkinsus olseni TaxID=32597 RepID=A0A7J6UFZ9_PEROL|nr:hypothetical protein FOZ62_014169 [Perkinsus olseni]